MVHVSMVTLGVRDLDASTRFYEHLGWERSSESVADVISFLRGGNVVLGLFGRDALAEDAGGATLHDAPGPIALAINVAAPHVVDTFLAAAPEAGGRVVKAAVSTDWGGYSGYLADPDGHLWEVAHNPGWPLDETGKPLLEDDPAREDAEIEDPRAYLEAFRAEVDAQAEGPSSDDLADAATAVLQRAMDEINALLGEAGTNPIIAVMTLLSERGMEARPASRESAILHAASGLVGGLLDVGDASED